MKKTHFTYYYIAFGVILLFFLLVHLILLFDVNPPFTADMFKDKTFDIDNQSCYLVYCQGEQVFYSGGMHKLRQVTMQTKLRKGMTIYTGADSSVCFYVKSYGYIHIYPQSILYINDLAHFIIDKNEDIYKKTEFSLEKGRAYFLINTFADNSDVTVRTDTVVATVGKGEFFAECSNSFNTKLICLRGNVFYRPRSRFFDKPDILKEKSKPTIQTGFFDNGQLDPFQQVDITSGDCAAFDQLLQQIYQSSVITSLDINYVLQHSTIKPMTIDKRVKNLVPTRLYQNKTFNDVAYIEISPKNDKYMKFDRAEIKLNEKYIFLVNAGTHSLKADGQSFDFNIHAEQSLVVPF